MTQIKEENTSIPVLVRAVHTYRNPVEGKYQRPCFPVFLLLINICLLSERDWISNPSI